MTADKVNHQPAPRRAIVGGVELELEAMERFKFSSDDTLRKDSEFGFGSVDDPKAEPEPQK